MMVTPALRTLEGAPSTVRDRPPAIQQRDKASFSQISTPITERQDSVTRLGGEFAAMQERLRSVEALLTNQMALPTALRDYRDEEESIPPPPY